MFTKKNDFWRNFILNNQNYKIFTSRDTLKLIISTSALLVTTLLIFGSIKMYSGDADELWFSFWDILPIIFLFSLGLFFVLIIFCHFIPIPYKYFFISTIFGLGVAFYIEGTFMPMDYGPLNGIPPHWAKYSGRILYNNIIWFLCILTPLFLLILKSNYFRKLIPAVCTALIIMQGMELAINLLNSSSWKKSSDYLTDEGKLMLGKEENIIVIILDSFDHRMFKRSIQHSNILASAFKDFTYYENSMPNFNFTIPAIPSILTGINYDNSIPFDDYIRSAYEQFPLLEELFRQGFDSRLFTFQHLTPMTHPELKAYIANRKSIEIQMRLKVTYLLHRYTLMRYAPVYLKELFWLPYDIFEKVKSNNLEFSIFGKYQDHLNTDLSFYKQLKRNGITLVNGKTFRFYHFQGAHFDINMDSNLNMINDSRNDDLAILDQAEGSLKIVAEFIKEMRNENVYDNSTIMIIGDHGVVSDPTMAYYLGTVMLIKDKKASFPSMRNLAAPAANSDVAATIMEIIYPDNHFSGTSIRKIGENAIRSRKYYFLNLLSSTKKGYLPRLVEFTNDNSTIQPDNFKITGNVLSSDGIIQRKYHDYQLGTRINWQDVIYDWEEQNKRERNIYGIRSVHRSNDMQRRDVFKTAGYSSTLGFLLSESDKDLSITMELASAFTESTPQRLFIEVNATLLPEIFLLTSSDFKTIKVNIPKELIKRDRRLILTLITPDAKQRTNPFEHIIYFKEALVVKSLVIQSANPTPNILFGS